MKKLSSIILKIFPYLLIFLFVVIGFLVFSPFGAPVPHTDSGVFLNLGAEILRGKVPYLETWDHKQPLLYWINAIGLWIAGGSSWGVWTIELTLFLIAIFLFYHTLKKGVSVLGSLTTILICVLATTQIMSGNYSEEFAVSFQILILASFLLLYLPKTGTRDRTFSLILIGVLGGFSFLIKQTYIDSVIAVVAAILALAWFEKRKDWLTHLLIMFASFVLVNLPVFFYFLSKHALREYITGAFLINKAYSSQGLLEWLQAFLRTLEFVGNNGIFLISFVIWAGILIYLLGEGWSILLNNQHRKNPSRIIVWLGSTFILIFAISLLIDNNPGIGLLEITLLACGLLCFIGQALLTKFGTLKSRRSEQIPIKKLAPVDRKISNGMIWAFLGLIDLPIVLFTITLSGKGFTHYYISLLPSALLLFGAVITFVENSAAKLDKTMISRSVLVALVLTGSINPVRQAVNRLQSALLKDTAGVQQQASEYLKNKTKPGEPILVWGDTTGIYYLTEREAATRYAFPFILYMNSPYRAEMLTTLLEDLQKNSPLYIIDSQSEEMPFIQGKSLESCLADNPDDASGLKRILNFVCSNYEFDRAYGRINIYKSRPAD